MRTSNNLLPSHWLHSVFTALSLVSLAAAQFPWATAIPRTGWNVTADSSQAGNEAARAIDGNSSTFWHTAYSPTVAPLPHYIQVDMKKSYVINGVSYQPRQDGGSNGNIGQHTVTVSNDGTTWSSPLQYGAWLNDKTTKSTFFSNVTARYVRITAQTEAQGANNQWSSMAELNIYSPDVKLNASTFAPPPTSQGRWDTTLVLPIVAAAGALSAQGNVIFWSAYRPDLFGGGTGQTLTAMWTPSSQTVTQRTVAETHHDMFCPGISLDANGRITVTGGNDSKNTSVFSPLTSTWASAAEMVIARGYQSSVALSDGRVFTIGGSWSGGQGGKNGEVYDPTTNKWTSLPGCAVAPMLTADAQGVYRADNHGWLFAWKNSTVFQAGPSKAMNFYKIPNPGSGNGSYVGAGLRGSDGDAMCGNAAMYDAVAGSILTAGGSPSYQDVDATSNAQIIALGDGNTVTVTKIPNMSRARAFANSVILPDGTVLVVGGQSHPVPFTDTTPVFPAELFVPSSKTWRIMAPIAVPRTYHSIALLMPDATVLAGGGGLCGTGCAGNHFDLQVFSPPYLFHADGTRVGARPAIATVSATQVKPGATITVTLLTTAGQGVTFSLVRFGAATHTVNTDQRRVPLPPTTASGLIYTLALPADPGVLVPGYWMLFAINSAGVPSVATTIKVLLA
ncbi:copper radical oxidase [Xylariaceae sp. FL0594]|nr:copper radical oxidase [Xylariaceae sp. FL0594]